MMTQLSVTILLTRDMRFIQKIGPTLELIVSILKLRFSMPRGAMSA